MITSLLNEHRLIERMIKLLGQELQRMKNGEAFDTNFISEGVDFFRTYADRIHHGKEEEILFKELSTKVLTAEHKQMIQRLKQEHVWAREAVQKISEANNRFSQGDRVSLTQMIYELGKIVEFYPIHIEKEDNHFFVPIKAYFSEEEQRAILDKFQEFDRAVIHKGYGELIDEYEKKRSI